jgi:cytochrome c
VEERKMKVKVVAFVVISLFMFTSVAYAGSMDDAKALVKRAVAYLEYQGKEKALAEINKRWGMFVMGELYVFAYDINGVMLAHPINPSLIGKSMIDLPDIEGKLFRKEIVEKAKKKGRGWVDYMYLNPETNKMELKTTYFQRVGDVILCCGAYEQYIYEGD